MLVSTLVQMYKKIFMLRDPITWYMFLMERENRVTSIKWER